MSFFKEFYFCGQCKKQLGSVEQLLYVENDSNLGFCSEDCIEKFYTPMVDHFEGLEKKWRARNNLMDEDVLELIGHPVYMDQLIKRPDEIYCYEQDTGEQVFTFIVHLNDPKFGEFSMMCLCLTYDNTPSFIIVASATSSELVLEKFRWGDPVEDISQFHSSSSDSEIQKPLEVDEQALLEVEAKKSTYLATLLECRSPADIPFESFNLYEPYFDKTMNDPDEIYRYKDDEGDSIFTYIKAHDREGVSFYYFIVCLKIDVNVDKNTDALVPIISFPSVDGEMYRLYQKGELVSGNLKS